MVTNILRALAIMATLTATACEAAERPEWVRLPALPDREGFAGGFAGTTDAALLFAGGANIPDGKWGREFVKVWCDGIWLLEKPDAAWRQVGRLPERRGYGGSISLPEGLLCIGGSNAERHTDEVVLLSWDGDAVRHVAWPELPKPCAMLAAARVGRAVYVVGGAERPDATRPLDTFWRLDLDDRAAGGHALPPCPGGPRILPVAAADADGFFLFSGAGLSAGTDGKPVRTYLRDAWRYRPTAGWQRLADVPRPAVAAPSPAAVIEGDVLIASGDDGAHVGHEPIAEHPGFPRDTLRYRLAEDRWTVEPGLPMSVVTAPTVEWHGLWVIASGETRPRVRTPDVWAMRTSSRSHHD
jgi:N-acetylneuraminate epimerase